MMRKALDWLLAPWGGAKARGVERIEQRVSRRAMEAGRTAINQQIKKMQLGMPDVKPGELVEVKGVVMRVGRIDKGKLVLREFKGI